MASRLLQLIPVLFGLTFLTFTLTYISPSDPAEMKFLSVGTQPTREVLTEMRHQMGLDRPFLVQYYDWLVNALHGDLGTSAAYGRSVLGELGHRLPKTIELAALSIALTVVVAVPLGLWAAVHQNGLADALVRGFSFVGIAVPSFWLGMMLILAFGVNLHWVSVVPMGKPGDVILPTITLAVWLTAQYTRRLRSAVLEELNRDYVAALRSRGLSDTKILLGHVLPNSLLTIVTMLGMSIGDLLGGATIVEAVFGWQGVGKMAVDAISNRDYPLIQGYVIWMGIIFVGTNLLVDLSYTLLDPRLRSSKGGGIS